MKVILFLILFLSLFLYPEAGAKMLHFEEHFQAPNFKTWLGTDGLGRDIFARLMVGSKYSFIIAFCAALITLLIGVMIAVGAVFYPRIVDQLSRYLFEVLMTLPYIPLIMVLVGIGFKMSGGFSFPIYVFLLGIVSWPPTMRIVRGHLMKLMQASFVKSAKVMGVNRRQFCFNILYRHSWPILQLQFAISFGQFLVIESILSYLGLGVQAPYLSLGVLIQEYQPVFISKPYLLLYPCGVIFMMIYIAHMMRRK